ATLGHPTGALDTFAAVFAGLAATGVRYVLMAGWVFRPETAPSGGEALARGRSWAVSLRAVRPELLALLALAAVLNLWALSKNGWANDYYAATVRSMASSWHNFLYDSFDPSGVMTVDKPPLALWVQALSVRVFGFHSLSMLVPQALMGVASVGLVYDLTRRRFGRAAGFVAGLVLALTPMTVAISRHNNPDALLVLCTVAALWFLVRGLEDGRTRWLVLGGGPFGGSPGVGRLLNQAFGGQAGWLLGFALVAAIGIAAVSRLRRADARTGWVLAVGGAFLTSAVVFSEAKGITHPYYVSFLA